MVWKWKVKERGTSMKILDLVHRDLNTIFDYLSCTNLNPIPTLPRGCQMQLNACHVRDPNHPGYGVDGLWTHANQTAQAFARGMASAQHPQNQHEPVFNTLTLTEPPVPSQPLLGAFAVGLRWLVHYSMDINPPFRSTIPKHAAHHLLANLTWSLEMAGGDDAVLQLAGPAPSCDSLLVTHADHFPIAQQHMRALGKYLDFTDPRAWARHGPRGFEAYWRTYARIDMKEADAPSPYEFDDGGRVDDVAKRLRLQSCSAQVMRIWRHMVLEGLEGEEHRREELVRRRKGLLGMVAWYRAKGIGFPIGKWTGSM
jgi:hypothetical protein